MDFGVQYLGSPSHSNLKFLLESGEELLANSMIISYNSPVIENLTTNLFQSTIEVQDFSKDAVQCFLEASYSGDVKKISRSNFREVNKMGHVFDVAWIVDRCYKYFKSLTETVKVNNYTEQVFVFEEAMFMFTRPLSGTLTTCLTQSHRRGPVEGVGARSAIVWQPLRPETCRGY